jgi:hypothetical protein
MRISVLNSRELAATVAAVASFDRTLQGTIRRVTKIIGQPEWQRAVGGNTTTALESRVLGDTARMTVSNQNVTLKSAAIGRKMRGGARPPQLAGAAEFGANVTRQTVTRQGTRYTRQGNRQFRRTNRKGYAVYPAAAKMIPRFAALWVQTTVRTFHEAFEARNG